MMMEMVESINAKRIWPFWGVVFVVGRRAMVGSRKIVGIYWTDATPLIHIGVWLSR